MPELPEVEFARICLRRWLQRKTLARVEAERTRVLRGSSPEALEALAGHRLLEVERRGKWLLLRFDQGMGVLGHLGMTGKFVLQKKREPAPSHSRARFVRADGAVIHYRDPRLFGRLLPGPLDAITGEEGWATLGPDAWDAPLSAGELHARLATRKRAVKEVLMDQTVLAGLGNIQATEALFLAKVHPARPAASITPAEARRLASAIRETLERTLAMNEGDEAITYVEEDPEQNPFLVYGRTGEPCPRCRTPLVSLPLGGRTSAFCPRCQPARGRSA